MRSCFETRLRPSGAIRGNPRRGVTLLECIATLALLSVVAALVAPILGIVNQMHAAALQHQIALLEVSNIHEHLAAHGRPLTQADLDAVGLSTTAREELVDPELALSLDDAGDDFVPAQRLTVSLTWEDATGERTQPVRVHRFLYAEEPRDP